MTYDPNRLDERSDRPIGYGAGRYSAGTYTAMVLGALIALVAIFYLIGQVGGNRTENANNPSETERHRRPKHAGAHGDAGAIADDAAAVSCEISRPSDRGRPAGNSPSTIAAWS